MPLSGQCGLPAGDRLPQILCFAHVTWTSSRSGSAQSKRWGGGLQSPEQATAARVNCTAAPQERAQGIAESLSHPCLFSFQDTETHRQHHTGVISTTRSEHRNALPPRRRVGPEAASSSLPSRASLLRWPLPRLIYTTLLVVPRASTRIVGPPPEGSEGSCRVSIDTSLAYM